MRFDKFTLKVQEAIAGSAIARLTLMAIRPLNRNICWSALLRQEEGIVGAILNKLGAQPDKIEQEITSYLEKQPGCEGAAAGQMYLSDTLK